MTIRTVPERERRPLTMAECDRMEAEGYGWLADIGRQYAVDRPRWWHRLRGDYTIPKWIVWLNVPTILVAVVRGFTTIAEWLA